jgi:hypothetical protein
MATQSMNLRQLRDTRKVKELLASGKTLELRERDRVIGKIVPVAAPEAPVHWPDFAAQAKQIFGERTIPGPSVVIEERGRS